MANYAKKNQSNGSFIFIWVLIVLLALGTVGIFYSYSNNHSTIITDKELAASLSVAFDKPAGKITSEDLASIEEISVTDIGASGTYIGLRLDGYEEAYEAYNAEGITDEEKAGLVNPTTLQLSAQLAKSETIFKELDIFTGLEVIYAQNYSGVTSETDVLAIAVEKFPNLREFVSYGYTVDDFSLVGKLTNLTTLSISGTPLTDISAIENLKNLEILDLSDAGITDISALSSLDNEKIETIYLNGNEIADWSPIAHIDAEKIIKDEETTENAEDSETSEDTDANTTEEESNDASENEEASESDTATETTVTDDAEESTEA